MTHPFATELHETLLRVAGWVPDDLIADARARLSQGQCGAVARTLAFAGTHNVLPLTDDDVGLLADLLDEQHVDLRVMDTIELADEPANPRIFWQFSDCPPAGARTRDNEDAGCVASDLVAAIADEPGVRGLWCAWREPIDGAPYPPPRPVYVVEVDEERAKVGEAADMCRLPGLAGRLQQMLASTGDAAPQVEVVSVHVDAPAYQRLARAYGNLLWAATPAPELIVARLFDVADSGAGPSFHPDHPRMTDETERARTLEYLWAGFELLMTMGTADDVVDPTRGAAVPTSVRTDGTWIWSDAASYYLEAHHLAPDPELLRHIQKAEGPPPRPDTVAVNRAMAILTQSSAAESVWITTGRSTGSS